MIQSDGTVDPLPPPTQKLTTGRRNRKPPEIVGESPALLAAIDVARRVARTKMPVLVTGETGTGKELLAQLIHYESERTGEFVDVDCGALPAELIEALLFGHKRGAFTGALEHAQGLVERAHGGTLFLDELGSLPLQGQAKLLRVLESGRVRRVGGSRTRTIDFRLVSTLQGPVDGLVAKGSVRLDLLQRVAGVVVRMPALVERGQDVVLLARHFATKCGRQLQSEAESRLVDEQWPGNVRELKWAVERAGLLTERSAIGLGAVRMALETGADLGRDLSGGTGSETRTTELRATCRAHRGDPERIAKALCIGRSTLYRRLRDASIDLRMFREL